jgi:hypothetical protein
VSARLDWTEIVDRAARVVYSFGTEVTLRQIFYALVADGTLPNSTSAYKTLSARTAEARREGRFPALTDRTRRIHNRYLTYASAQEALSDLPDTFLMDRTEGQESAVYLAVEKDGMVAQLESWFGELGFPILALKGYSSQTYCDEIEADVDGSDRLAVLIYAGDFDPSGEDIERDFHERTNFCFDESVRVALTAKQVEQYGLPPQMGKASDTRAGRFVARHGRLVQVELDALPPDRLRALYREAIGRFWDESTFEEVRRVEERERAKLAEAGA